MSHKKSGSGGPKQFGFEDVVQLFNNIPKVLSGNMEISNETKGFPPIDIYEIQDCVVVESELPGINPADVSVYIRGNELTIEGNKSDPTIPNSESVRFLCMERSFGSFKRIIKLPVSCNPNDSNASYKKGILTIRIKKIVDKRGEKKEIKIE